jgi:hypothetical protein
MDERNGVIGGNLAPNSDHAPVATLIMTGEALTVFHHPPGFALYIISAVKMSEGLGASYFFWRLVQDCLSTGLTAILTMSLMLRLSESVWVSWGSIFLLLYNLSYSAGTAADLAMASFLPWFLGSLLLLVEALQHAEQRANVYSFLAGIVLAISGFIRPDILLYLPFLAVVLACLSRVSRLPQKSHKKDLALIRSRLLFIALLGFAVALLPWVAYASSRSGSFVIYSTNFVSSHLHGMLQFPGNPVSAKFRELGAESSLSDVLRLHFSLMQTNFADELRLWAQKLWQPWYCSQTGRWNLVLGGQTLLIVPFVVAGLVFWLRQRGLDLGFAVAFSVIGYFWLITMAVLSINRYMPPAYPFLGMFAGISAQRLWPVLRGK